MSEQKGRTVVSVSLRKNVEMVVYHNTNAQGVRQSITRFQPLNPAKPVYKRAFPRGGAAR